MVNYNSSLRYAELKTTPTKKSSSSAKKKHSKSLKVSSRDGFPRIVSNSGRVLPLTPGGSVKRGRSTLEQSLPGRGRGFVVDLAQRSPRTESQEMSVMTEMSGRSLVDELSMESSLTSELSSGEYIGTCYLHLAISN